MSQEGNAYAEYGIHCHNILERWAKGELMSFELSEAYESEYDQAVKHSFPPFPRELASKYFEEGLAYFNAFDGFGEQEILSVEDRFEISIRGNRFVGIADLILRDRNTGAISVIDHKSKSMQSLMKDLHANKRQLYLYAAHVREKYGIYPTLLRFNMFRYNKWVDEFFDSQAYSEMQDWTEQTIHRIRSERDWQVSASGYFCKFICSVRDHCPTGETIINSRRHK